MVYESPPMGGSDPNSETPGITQNFPPWGLDRIDSATGLDFEYNYDATGEGVTIFIADGGVLFWHPEFFGRFQGCMDFTGQGCLSNDHGTHVGKWPMPWLYGIFCVTLENVD